MGAPRFGFEVRTQRAATRMPNGNSAQSDRRTDTNAHEGPAPRGVGRAASEDSSAHADAVEPALAEALQRAALAGAFDAVAAIAAELKARRARERCEARRRAPSAAESKPMKPMALLQCCGEQLGRNGLPPGPEGLWGPPGLHGGRQAAPCGEIPRRLGRASERFLYHWQLAGVSPVGRLRVGPSRSGEQVTETRPAAPSGSEIRARGFRTTAAHGCRHTDQADRRRNLSDFNGSSPH